MFIKHYNSEEHYPFSSVKKYTSRIGADPFPKRVDNIRTVLFDITGVMNDTDVTKNERLYEIQGVNVVRANDNPVVIDGGGNIQYYQRPYCWTLEQKQLLIESIYEGIGCGLVITRRRSDKELHDLAKKGVTKLAWLDIVDGKQRMNAVHSFVNNEFADFNGRLFSDFSEIAQRKFLNQMCFQYGQLPEETTDQEVVAQFLRTNFTGVPQSKEHLDYIKSINL